MIQNCINMLDEILIFSKKIFVLKNLICNHYLFQSAQRFFMRKGRIQIRNRIRTCEVVNNGSGGGSGMPKHTDPEHCRKQIIPPVCRTNEDVPVNKENYKL
jgi:hypothetical protein